MKKSNLFQDTLEREIQDLLAPYPDPMGRTDFRKACRIGTRTSLYLLQSGLVPCENTGKQTRCYKIAKADVAAYLRRRLAEPAYYTPPSGWYKNYPNHKPPAFGLNGALLLTDTTRRRVRRWYENLLTRQPDVLDAHQIACVTGYASRTVSRWCTEGRLKAFPYINELYRLTLTPYYNDELLHTLEQTATSPQQQLEFKRVVEGFLASVMSLPRSEILRVYIMNDTALYSYTRTPYEMAEYNNYLESDWYNQACATTDPILLPPRLERVYGDDLTPIFSVVRQLRSKEDNDITLGVVKVDANYTGIRNICDQVDLDAGGSLLIINEQNQILYSSGALLQELDAEEVEALASPAQGDLFRSGQGKYIVNRFVLPDCGITLLAVHSYASLMRPLQENLVKTVLLALGSMLVAAALIIFVVARFLKPLFDIIRLMHAVEGGDLQVRAQVRSHNEIGYLAESFNDMVGALGSMIQRNAQLAQEVYRAQYLNKEAQYNSLCSQIKPHFLYNVLNTISLLIKCGEYKTAVRSVEDLSYYLGGIMNVDQDITLRRELNICQAYLDLIQLRYQDRLTYTIQVDEDLLDCKIPSLTLQPLIENAVKYACEPRRQATEIAVTSRREDGMLRLCVTDNGPGIGEATLEKIRRSMEEPDAGPGADGGDKGSIGILNIYRRLRLRYGRQAAFLIDTSGQGTCVSLRIPLPCEGENNVSYDDRG